MIALNTFVGILLITYGKKVIWLLLTTVVYFAGQSLLPTLFPEKEKIFIITISALIAGILMILMIFIKKVALTITGIFGGGYLLLNFIKNSPQTSMFSGYQDWVIFLLGSIVGVLFAFILFNWFITLFSAMTGSLLILDIFHLDPFLRMLFLIPMLILGVYLQTRLTSSRKSQLAHE